ncbi:MAG: RNA 2',3'-cyclic phosphodiesterase [Rhodospirillales bacterium]|jgi:2'-5' RNA ligase|nr:RNA 2',3'-cyclic phosphodiesterase [Rhodospirillales bacterium]MDP6644471.1 RNA 2',3'-cyclic phosphodiesterase [Rhodospirillales bacterium]MDP6840198.1 RNA 2',3'-cyclic phosphodiesterase [Rhodospirillales bacterium]
MLRLFVGLGLPDAVRLQLAAMNGGVPDARWVAPENLHLSLRFIGEVDEFTAEDIDAALVQIHAPPVEITLTGVGCFESRGRARAVWAGAKPCRELLDLQARVEASLQRAGLEPEGRKFTPHVTLARLKRVPVEQIAPYLSGHGGFAAPPFSSTEFILYRSHLGHGGANYQVLETYPLI